jgi:hypothetical protein
MSRISEIDFTAIREGLKALPRTANYTPGDKIELGEILVVPSHRAALDPDRALVVGNRGVGKSFWTHVLAEPQKRAHVAKTFRELAAVDVFIGFNASARIDPVAPTEDAVNQAFREVGEADPLWRTVLVRVAKHLGVTVPEDFPRVAFAQEVSWVRAHGEQVDRIVTQLDDQYARQNKKLVLVFDALDRLGTDWQTKRTQTTALLKRALAARSYRSIRLKLFMRRDQFEDPLLFQFPDGSKIANQRVDLLWSSGELYTLLFSWLAREEISAAAFAQLQAAYRVSATSALSASEEAQKVLVNAIAGEFMGATEKKGRVYTWLPLHLSDARGETSPRTFLTAWREAARDQPAQARRALDHHGIHEGVRKASEDRLRELNEDYWWISLALQPLRGQQVPIDRSSLKRLWSDKKTTRDILAKSIGQLPPVRLDSARSEGSNLEDALIRDLVAIGIIEVRPNDKINIPDIFRLEAGIKRRGGVPAPKRAQRE